MKKIRPVFVSVFCLWSMATVASLAAEPQAELTNGPFPVGFRLVSTMDHSRTFPSLDSSGFGDRPLRIYIWYPARKSNLSPLTVGDFVSMATDDFKLSRGGPSEAEAKAPLPVPLAKGLDAPHLRALLDRPLESRRDAEAAAEEFPLLVLGQGLYYESPLAEVILSEYLASRGYIVATCPLLGTQYRLVNRNVEDLETEVRDMEFVKAAVSSLPSPRARGLAVIGYDLGGMAGLILAMRNPEVEAFLSLDPGILYPTGLGIPENHPQYREDRFVIPWMHLTQARFIEAGRAQKELRSLGQRKAYGDTWIVSVPTINHGQFTSFADFGIRRPVPGYWEQVAEDSGRVYDGICRLAGDFFDAVLKKDPRASARLDRTAAGDGRPPFTVDHTQGAVPPPSSRSLIQAIIEKGLAAVRPDIERIRSNNPAAKVMDESELSWLGYHFLLWWNREGEALDIFRLNVDLNPASAEARASLGEALMVLDRKNEAVAAFRKALELNPEMPAVKAALDRLTRK
jgi:tetratricopeptide (TPR) repeat protein